MRTKKLELRFKIKHGYNYRILFQNWHCVGIALQNQARLQQIPLQPLPKPSWNCASKSSTVTTRKLRCNWQSTVGIALQNQARLQLPDVQGDYDSGWNCASKSSTVTTNLRFDTLNIVLELRFKIKHGYNGNWAIRIASAVGIALQNQARLQRKYLFWFR